ncbi:RecX family transcriptional regulator [Candidatus Gracilibacteria bacterium]|nr:RecX family transcriptional regulator [Candidatus Gracilibacteria bacterium]
MAEKKEISQKITNYAIWYYLKYFPSIGKMKQKLDMKFGPKSEKGKKYGGIFEDDIDYILKEKMGNIIVEKEIISANIRNYLMRGKNYYYIVQKLTEKRFIKEEFIEILMSEFDSENRSLINPEKLYKQVLNLKKKNKSKNYIRNKFVDRPLDNEIVDEVLNEIFGDDESKQIKNELFKVLKLGIMPEDNELKATLKKLDFKERQKVMQKLVGKGFSFGEINDTLKGIEE